MYRTWAKNHNEVSAREEQLQAQVEFLKMKYEKLELECILLLEYRRLNTINFQLEKLDDYLSRIGDLIGRGGLIWAVS